MTPRYSIDPADTDGGVTAALIEEEAKEWPLSAIDALAKMSDKVREAERELAEARKIIDARMTGTRAMRAEDVTDEMVRRAVAANYAEKPTGEAIDSYMRLILAAALTEPQRPEGAEGIQRDIDAWTDDHGAAGPPEDNTTLADYLAAMGYRKAES